jgi:hypothetical protein
MTISRIRRWETQPPAHSRLNSNHLERSHSARARDGVELGLAQNFKFKRSRFQGAEQRHTWISISSPEIATPTGLHN